MNWLWHGNSRVVFKTKENQKKDKFKKSILMFLGLSVIATLIAMFFLLLSYDFDISNAIGSNGTEVVGEDSNYIIKKVSGSEDILMYCTDDEEENVTFLCAVKFNMTEKEITVLSLPTLERVYELNGKRASASECYRNAGELQLVNAVNKYMGMEFGKYIGCKAGSVEGISANFETLKIDFKKDITFKNGDDILAYTKGTHEIEDDKISKLLTYNTNSEYNHLRSEILLQMFRQYFNESSLENRNIIYSNIISQTTSNISIVDMISYKDYIVVLSSDKVKKDYIVADSVEDYMK